jgi:hypothetical protein
MSCREALSRTDISKEIISSIIKVIGISKLRTTPTVTGN